MGLPSLRQVDGSSRGWVPRLRRPLHNRHSRGGGNPGVGLSYEGIAFHAVHGPSWEVIQRPPCAGTTVIGCFQLFSYQPTILLLASEVPE